MATQAANLRRPHQTARSKFARTTLKLCGLCLRDGTLRWCVRSVVAGVVGFFIVRWSSSSVVLTVSQRLSTAAAVFGGSEMTTLR